MNFFEIILIGFGLSMDAFAVSICKGLSIKKMSWKHAFIIALYFGAFQAIMPIIGYLLGTTFSSFVKNIDHWIAFVLLSFIGFGMIKSSFSTETNEKNISIDVKNMFLLSIATNIDALAIGITFSFFKINIIPAVVCIGLIAFVLSTLGVKIGNKFGNKFQNKAELIGGIILIIIGLKILLEHLNIINF